MLHVLLETPSPRARYVVRHVFERMLGWPVAYVGSREELRTADGPRLSYGPLPVHDSFHVPSSGWFDEPRNAGASPWSSGTGGDHVLFPVGSRWDVFAAIFHLIALEEEYTIASSDQHGRIPADDLLLVRSRAHGFPIVDQWALGLGGKLREAFPSLHEPERVYRHVLTVDVDNGLKYAGRSWSRALGASVKELFRGQGASLRQRWRVRSGEQEDPYMSFADRLVEAKSDVDRVIAFFLTRGEGRYDHAARLEHPLFHQLLHRVGGIAEIGLHPSYESSRIPALFKRERDQLGELVRDPVRVSRQHFLRWKLPSTFRALLELGIEEDHSIGFSDRTGFRAGTCTPFPWYDLEREEETTLMLHPFAVMDSALADQSGEGLRQALAEMKRVSDAVRKVQGTFTSVWHDRFLSGHAEFKGGPEAMRELVQHARA